MLTIIAVITSIIVVISSTTTSFANESCTVEALSNKSEIVRKRCITQCNPQCTRDMCQLVEIIKWCRTPNSVTVDSIDADHVRFCGRRLLDQQTKTCNLS
jgi:hypothetical protein